jgi:hypothetical protein
MTETTPEPDTNPDDQNQPGHQAAPPEAPVTEPDVEGDRPSSSEPPA